MAKPLTPHRLGLIFGIGLALMHAIWALAVAISPAMMQTFYRWVLDIHFINLQISINSFDLGKAFQLVILTGISGYIIGFIFGWIHKLLEE